jgi:hypothetical protein
MKRIIAITISILMALPAICQEEKVKQLENLESGTDDTINKTDTVSQASNQTEKATSDEKDTVIVEVGKEIFSVKEVGDETHIKIGNKEYRVVEDNDGVAVYKGSNNGSHRRNKDKFRGHIGGLELGFNGFLSDNWSTALDPGDSYFDLNTTKSYNWNLLLPCVNIPFTRHFGMVTTIGIAFNKYRFDGDNSIIKDENGVIGPLYPETGASFSKSRLLTTYAILPLMMEVQIPVSSNYRTINLGAGVIGAAKLGSHTKIVYSDDDKHKESNKDDFSLNTFRWGATGRIGYEFFQIYGTYYFTSLFEKGKGPELYPFEVGIAFTIND